MHRRPFRYVVVPTEIESPLGTIRAVGGGELPGGHDRLQASYYVLILITRGRARYEDDRGRQAELEPGHLVRLLPGTVWSLRPVRGETLRESAMSFYGPVFDLWREVGLLGDEPPVVRLDPVDYWEGRIRGLGRGEETVDSPLLAVHRLQSLLADVRAYRLSHDRAFVDRRWLRRAKRVLIGEDLARPVDLRDAAAAMHMSYEGFRKRFTRLAGTSPARFQVLRRVQAAEELLVRFCPTNHELAMACGFNDEFHFSKRFKQVTGRSPSDYRRSVSSHRRTNMLER